MNRIVSDQAKDLRGQVLESIEKGIDFLCGKQTSEGRWRSETKGHINLAHGPGVTSLAVYALATCPLQFIEKYREAVRLGIKYLLSTKDKDGAIGILSKRVWDYPNYATALTILSFLRFKPLGWEDTIRPLISYLKGAQLDERWGYIADDKHYGGWDCGKPQKSIPGPNLDISSASYVLTALDMAGLDKTDPVFKKARLFIKRCQNFAEGDEKIPKDGGFMFTPWGNGNKGEAIEFKVSEEESIWYWPSYGSATCDGLLSLLALGFSKEDPRVQAALNWVRQNFTVERNPGIQPGTIGEFDKGVFYYYLFSLASVLDRFEMIELETEKGKIAWANEIAEKLISLQRVDGGWVNPVGSMREDEPIVATSFALLALNTVSPWIKEGICPTCVAE